MSYPIREALAELVQVIDARHYGRMPDEVAQAMAAASAALAQPTEPVALTDAQRKQIHAKLLSSLEEPSNELLEVFQRAFTNQLHRRRHKPQLESAEKAGIRAMLKHVIEASRTGGGADG